MDPGAADVIGMAQAAWGHQRVDGLVVEAHAVGRREDVLGGNQDAGTECERERVVPGRSRVEQHRQGRRRRRVLDRA